MPLFDYFATFDESLEILRDMCDGTMRVIAVPGLFDEPKAPTFDSVTDELVAILKFSPGFYLSGPFTSHPVQFTRLPAPSEGKYAVNVLAQGPVLQGLMARVNVVEGAPRLLPGNISYQDKYRNPETNAWEPASSATKAAYRRFVSQIKKRALAHPQHKDVYMTATAREMLENGKATVKDPRLPPR